MIIEISPAIFWDDSKALAEQSPETIKFVNKVTEGEPDINYSEPCAVGTRQVKKTWNLAGHQIMQYWQYINDAYSREFMGIKNIIIQITIK